MAKIGLLGGSFNPIHNGHLALARVALEKLVLDEVWFLPTGNHPLKNSGEIIDIKSRLKLLHKAIAIYPRFKVSELDATDSTPSYTDILIKKIFRQHQKDEFFFLAGDDIIVELPRWHNFRWLLDNITFVIFTRDKVNKKNWQERDFGDRMIFLPMEPVPISSRQIRRRIEEGTSIKGLVPDIIEKEIVRLYKRNKQKTAEGLSQSSSSRR
ncbi:MAG: nicotinate (nicotinamide) nucleotide adenylyltransferase [Candidatus Cloacimonetes bacterium]|nr:nicotinate (nicotinamide) nucleotide adenylyltransferase [Candidatus Cloacimonadota bacterium]